MVRAAPRAHHRRRCRASKSCAPVSSAEEALAILQRVSPDVISLDIRLPGMNGFEATRRIMRDKPTPIVVCSASVESDDLNITMNALRAGALAVVEKPVGTTRADYERIARTLCTARDHERGQGRAAAFAASGPPRERTVAARGRRRQPRYPQAARFECSASARRRAVRTRWCRC